MLRLAVLMGMLGACALDGPQTRARVDDEPPGENCEQGGLAVRTGLDVDEDKYVDDDEVMAETYECRFESETRCDGGKILTGRVTLATAEDEDKINGVTCIEGDLVIASNTAFELLGTSQLHTVVGHVVIAGNPSLQTLDGLDALRNVRGEVLIQGNDGLVDLAPIGKLAHGDLSIIANDFMTDLHGLEEMSVAPGSITIAGNPELSSLTGLEGLRTGGYAITIRSNPLLSSVEALRGLQTSGNLTIADNSQLDVIDLSALTSVDGQFSITSARALHRLVLPSLIEVRTSVIVEGTGLGELWLPSLRSTGRLMVRRNQALVTVRTPSLDSVAGGIELADAPSLRIVDASSLGFLDGFLRLRGIGIIDLTGFARLYEVGRLELAGLPALTSVAGLGNVAVIDGDFEVTDNGALASFDGLDALIRIEGNFTVRGSKELKESAQRLVERVEVHGEKAIY